MTGPATINHVNAKKLPMFLSILYHNLVTNYIYITIIQLNLNHYTAEFNGLSSAIYVNRILHSKLIILAKI